jgi:hypothetical protein
LQTAGKPEQIQLSFIQSPEGWKADGADMVLLQVEVMDKDGNRCPLANDLIHFEVEGPAEWRGGIAQGENNYILSKDLPVECGINRAHYCRKRPYHSEGRRIEAGRNQPYFLTCRSEKRFEQLYPR